MNISNRPSANTDALDFPWGKRFKEGDAAWALAAETLRPDLDRLALEKGVPLDPDPDALLAPVTGTSSPRELAASNVFELVWSKKVYEPYRRDAFSFRLWQGSGGARGCNQQPVERKQERQAGR